MESTWGPVALSSWEHIDGMEEAERRPTLGRKGSYRGCFRNLSTALTCGPPIFGPGFMLSWGLKVLFRVPPGPSSSGKSLPPTPDFSALSSPLCCPWLWVPLPGNERTETCPFQVLFSKKMLNMSRVMKGGTGSYYKFMCDYVSDPVLGKRLNYSRFPKVVSEMRTIKSLALHLAPRKSSLNLNYYYH